MSEPWAGGEFGERGHCLLAPNPGIMTLDGTNTWVLREPGASTSVVVDPGPIEDGHLDRVDETTGEVGLILLTHHHFDHSEVAAALAERKGCAVRALDPDWCVGADPLADDEEITVGGLSLRVVATPGHTADSVSFLLPTERVLLSGDMVLGRGTTVVAHPDGRLGPYFESIERMRALVTDGQVATIWPAHGPVLDEAGAVLDFYLAHRRERLDQVRSALEQLKDQPHPEGIAADELPRRVVEVVYADVDETLWDAAELSVRAQLAYLAERG
ncbi:MBL fold metallo-hydrolase [Nocardioides sp.]|uniref:MBL fold metallo-hydrolase n=1 Tax=Nocardioides sp. TaxID=35761 RepID=UPI002722ECA4|nr:MBL fold metallo-hydrolase [Nocardioides sp.]MDO9455553.1 MBL fold metallo-hydrolase [Nocardioides sp.]